MTCKLAKCNPDGYDEFSVPPATVLRVDFKKPGKQEWHEDKTAILGDLGIIRGNGLQNVQRLCWNSLDTWMTSDIPSEARWRSLNWGVLKLVGGAPHSTGPTK